MIEWANEVWREVENCAILLEQEEGDGVSILKGQEKLSETILEYYVLNSAKKMLLSSINVHLKSIVTMRVVFVKQLIMSYLGHLSSCLVLISMMTRFCLSLKLQPSMIV